MFVKIKLASTIARSGRAELRSLVGADYWLIQSNPVQSIMRTEVIKADSIDEAAERILDELKDTRSISSRNNVIYFDGWDGLGASAVLRAVAQRLTAMASSDEAPAGLKFDQIIHVDCSKWESKRALQRAFAEQLELPASVMEMFDRQDEEDDIHGIPEGSRTEIPQVFRATLQRIQELSHRFLVIFHNGSNEEIDLGIFGFLLSGYYSTAKVLWTFQGRFRLYPMMKVYRALNMLSSTQTGAAATDVFLSAVTGKERHPQVYWNYLVQQEAADLVAAACKSSNTGQCLVPGDLIFQPQQQQVLQGDMLVSDADEDDGPWRAADALQHEMLIDVEHWQHNLESLPCHLVRSADSMACMPYWTSPPYETLLSPVRDMFQQFDKLGVLKLSHCTLSFSSLPFLSSNNLRVLWLDHIRDDQVINKDRDPEKMEEGSRRFFQRLWVLDVCYSCCDWIFSAQVIALMTQLRELNVVGAHDWDIGQLQGWLPNIRKLRVTKSTVGCTSCLENNNLSLGMNKMELLDFSGNRTMQEEGVAANLSGISTSSNELETVTIIDGCVGIPKFSFRGCAKLKNLLLSGLFEDLCTLDLSGTAVKTLDLSAMTTRSLDELILDNCDKLCVILWPPKDKRKSYLTKLRIDNTESASACRSGEEKVKDGSTVATGSPSSWPKALVDHARPPSEFNWYISINDTRLLKSIVPCFKNYFEDHRVHLEISSPSCCPNVDGGGTESEGIQNGTGVSNRWQRQPQYNNNASKYYADVATIIVEDHLLQEGEGNGNDASTITRTGPCPPPHARLFSSNCYLYTQDQQRKTKAGTDGGAIATIPSIICDRAFLHVHDSLYNTSIPGPARWYNLEWCRVERCPKLDFIFTAPRLGDDESRVRMCYYLATFWASKLLRTRFMWDMSKLPLSQIEIRSFEDLTLLHLDFCPRLIHVLPFSSMPYSRRLLETIEIVWCGGLRVIFPLLDTSGTWIHQEQQQKSSGAILITMVEFPNLKRIHLHELPMLESICGLGRMYAPNLEIIKIRGCWSLRHLPAISKNRSKNKVECDCEKEWWDRLEWDGLDGKHQPSLYKPVHSRYYKKKQLRGSVLI